MIDILFIHPNSSQQVYQGLANKHSAIEPPIWAGMLTRSFDNAGYCVELLDCEALHYGPQEATTVVRYLNPSLICVVVYGQQPSASTQNMEGAVVLADEIKKHTNTPIVFVGGHIAAVHEEVLERHPSVDYICQNEGVYTLHRLMECYAGTNNKPTINHLKEIKGLGFRWDGQILINEPSPIVSQKDLSTDLPGIAWNKLPQQELYRTAGWHAFTNNGEKSPFVAIYTSLGCCYTCQFCCINSINRITLGRYSTQDSPKFRYWPPEHTIKELEIIANSGIRNLKIADELFILNPNHFIRLCELIIERKYDFNIWCYGRVDTCKPQYLDILKKAGVNFIGLGIESINKTVRQDVTKGHFTDVKIDQVMRDIENAGIEIGANYIFGLPEDTMASMQETANFALEKNTAMTNVYCAIGYPGSKLYLDTKENHPELLPDTYSGYSQHSYDFKPLPSRHLRAEEILKFRDDFWMDYHTRPEYLQKIKNKFGYVAYNNMVDATSIKLKRKLLGD